MPKAAGFLSAVADRVGFVRWSAWAATARLAIAALPGVTACAPANETIGDPLQANDPHS